MKLLKLLQRVWESLAKKFIVHIYMLIDSLNIDIFKIQQKSLENIMEIIPVRSIKKDRSKKNFSENFSTRDIHELLGGNDLVQELHRHDFYFILLLKKGKGEHIIDFTPYEVKDYSIFFMRPGQVHKLTLKKGSTGFIMQFKKDFYYPKETPARMHLRRASSRNHCQLNAEQFKRLSKILTDIRHE